MRRLSPLVLVATLAISLLALVGCGTVSVQELESEGATQSEGQLQEQDTGEDSAAEEGQDQTQDGEDTKMQQQSQEQKSSGTMPEGQGQATDIRVTFVDVGKGDCILVQANGSAALIDAGYDNTSDKVLACLREQGIDHLACVIVTHYDRDHIGGVGTIGKMVPVDMIYLPGYEGGDKNYRTLVDAVDKLGHPSQQVTKETSVQLGGANLTIYPTTLKYIPGTKGEEGNDNDLSLVVSLIAGKDSYLFTGDLEKDGIAAYLNVSRGQFDVLKVPHHGQRNANTDDLLEEVEPKIAIVTDSKDDPADKKTLSLLKDVGADAYRTSVNGTVVVTSDGTGNYSVTSERG